MEVCKGITDEDRTESPDFSTGQINKTHAAMWLTFHSEFSSTLSPKIVVSNKKL